jgi:hypothetical protein
MSIDIMQIFQRKYEAEIIKVTPQKRNEIIKLAQSFICEKFAENHALDGGELEDLHSAIAQSLLELFVRDRASQEKTGPMLRIDNTTYESALKSFREFIDKRFASYDLLEAFWLQQAKMCISNTFSNFKNVFKTYLIGELCEYLYVDNRTAEAVIEELKDQQFIKIQGLQHGQELLQKTIEA